MINQRGFVGALAFETKTCPGRALFQKTLETAPFQSSRLGGRFTDVGTSKIMMLALLINSEVPGRGPSVNRGVRS